MLPYPPRSSSFGQRAITNHMLFASMAFVVLLWSTLTTAEGVSARFTQESFGALAKFVDYKQVGIPIAGGLLLYLVISLISHQSRSYSAEEGAFYARELIHAEVSSILLSSASLALVVGFLFCWAGLFTEGLKTASWWPAGLFLAYLLRPKTQDRFAS
jgi:hypothetical protein